MGIFRSIKIRLLVFGLSISLIPISIITTLYYFNARNTIKKQIIQKLIAVAESKRLHILYFMEETSGRVIDFGSDGFIRDSLVKISREGHQSNAVANLNRHLKVDKKPLDHHIRAIFILDLEGKIVSCTDETLIGKDMSKQEIFIKGLSNKYGETYVGQTYYSPYMDTNCIFMSAPLTSKGGSEKIGVIINAYDLESLNEITADHIGLGETGEILMGKKRKNEIVFLTTLRYASNAPLSLSIPEDTDEAKPMKLALEGSNGTLIAPDYRPVEVLSAYQYISDFDWGLVVKIDKAEAFAPLKKSIYYLSLTGIASIFIVLGLTVVISTSLSRPIRRLSQTIQKVSGGDLDARAQETTSDEVGILARGFNSMIQRIKDSHEELVRTERLVVLGKLSSGIAHEIRNPLGVIDSSAYYLKKKHKDADEKTMTHLNRIIKQTRISTDIIQSLQDLTKIKEPQKARMDIASVIEDGINISNIPQAVKIIEKVPKDKLFVDTDGRQLLIVFNNILNNAVQAMDKKGTIWVTANGGSNNWVEVSFRDTGPGIPSEDLNKIFHSFFGTKAKGLGFGLTICQMIMEKNGGDIKAQSEPGKGTTFIVRLPSIKANNEGG